MIMYDDIINIFYTIGENRIFKHKINVFFANESG